MHRWEFPKDLLLKLKCIALQQDIQNHTPETHIWELHPGEEMPPAPPGPSPGWRTGCTMTQRLVPMTSLGDSTPGDFIALRNIPFFSILENLKLSHTLLVFLMNTGLNRPQVCWLWVRKIPAFYENFSCTGKNERIWKCLKLRHSRKVRI
jgi:hypothetical protein